MLRVLIHAVMSSILLVLSLFSFSAVSYAAEKLYVNDQLKVAIRSGASTEYRIVKFITSGTVLTVLARSDSGKYIQVKTPRGKIGWIDKKDTMTQQSARERLVVVKKQFANVDKTISTFEKKIKKLEQENIQAQQQYKSLESEKKNVEATLSELQVTASTQILLSRKNKKLEYELDQALASEAQLEKENLQLKNNVKQEWFVLGGGVSIGSLLLGLVLTRINWKRKKDNWGDSF